MASIADQVHTSFKVFCGPVEGKASIASVARKVEAFVRRSKIAPKSIGVEYLEATRQIVLSLGFCENEEAYDIKLTAIPLGKLGVVDEASLARIEKKDGDGRSKNAKGYLPRALCHRTESDGRHDTQVTSLWDGDAEPDAVVHAAPPFGPGSSYGGTAPPAPQRIARRVGVPHRPLPGRSRCPSTPVPTRRTGRACRRRCRGGSFRARLCASGRLV